KTQIKRQYQQQYDELEKADLENQNLLRQLSPNAILPENAKSKYRIELEALKLREIMEIRELDIRIQNIKKGTNAKVSEKGVESAKLEYEAKSLSELEKDHFILAATEGIIGQMEFAAGDKVEKYVTLLKFYGTHPNMVTTYIGDGQLSQIGTGDSVQIISLNDAAYQLKGVVHSMGTRITALPERLKKVPELRAWGREIQIMIPENNTLLQGEKVRVKL
ncbi:MAG TPA: hypothetical protein VFX48_06410, partial [Saprospiraceae bacterium]|nr:hypothetical protein [Saprospiraceae bacterium]